MCVSEGQNFFWRDHAEQCEHDMWHFCRFSSKNCCPPPSELPQRERETERERERERESCVQQRVLFVFAVVSYTEDSDENWEPESDPESEIEFKVPVPRCVICHINSQTTTEESSSW